MKFKFTPGMFAFSGTSLSLLRPENLAAAQANAALEKHLATCPVVYTNKRLYEHDLIWSQSQTDSEKLTDTHRARIFDIEELKPTECGHEIVACLFEDFGPTYRVTNQCQKCKKIVRPTKWEVAGE
jgi:hypothetical protein